jgi:hypothetical protein
VRDCTYVWMGVCISVGGCRGLRVLIVVGGAGEQQTCGARVAVDSEQTYRRQVRHVMSGPRDQREAASWRT